MDNNLCTELDQSLYTFFSEILKAFTRFFGTSGRPCYPIPRLPMT